MPIVGETKIRFGRSYVYINPDTSVSTPENSRVGTWRLNRDSQSEGGGDGPVVEGALGFLAEVLESGGILEGQLVIIDSNGIRLAKADNLNTAIVAGVAIQDGALGDNITVTRNETIDFFNVSGLVDGGGVGGYLETGANYYLSAANAGNWTPVPDIATGGYVVAQVGTATGPNAMSIEIQPPLVI